MTRPNAAAIVIVTALVFAGLASWGAYSYLNREALKSKATPGQAVVVAASDIPIGTRLNGTQLKQVAWPSTNIPQGGFQQLQPLEGRIAVRHLSAGDAITEQKLMPKEVNPATGVMSYIVPEGHRAVTVGVNEVAGVAGFLAPNNRVDVVLTAQIPGSTTENISKIVLQNVPILATGQITEQKEGKPVVVPTVTLDLTAEDAEKLVLASHKGSLQLLLRNIIDTAQVDSRGATIGKVLGGVERPVVRVAAVSRPRRAPKPVKVVAAAPPPAPMMINVEIIKGRERTSKQFSE